MWSYVSLIWALISCTLFDVDLVLCVRVYVQDDCALWELGVWGLCVPITLMNRNSLQEIISTCAGKGRFLYLTGC